MTDFSRIKKNTFYSIITISSRLIANVFLFWLLARFYGPKIFGQFTFAHTLATTFIVFADFGIEIILTTKLAAEKGNSSKAFEKLLGLKLVFLVIALVLMIAIGLTFDLNEDAYKLLFIFSIYLLFTSLNNFFAGVFKGYEKFIYETRVSILANFILILFTIIFLILHRSIIEIAIAFAASRVIGTIYSIYNLWLVDKNLTFKADLSGFKLLGGKVLIFGFHLIFSYLFFQIDTLLLAKFKGDYSVGIYQSVFKLVMLPLVIPDVFINAFLPTLSRYFFENKSEWIKLGSIMGRILFIFALPISVVMFFYAKEIINLVYGLKNYQDAVNVFRIFGLIILVRFLLEPFALMLTTSDRQIVRLITVVAATILNVSLNYFMIPKYDTFGASVVSLTVNTFVGIVYFFVLKNDFKSWLLNIRNVVALISVYSIGFIFSVFIHLNFIFEISILLILISIAGYKFYLTESEKEILISFTSKIKLLS